MNLYSRVFLDKYNKGKGTHDGSVVLRLHIVNLPFYSFHFENYGSQFRNNSFTVFIRSTRKWTFRLHVSLPEPKVSYVETVVGAVRWVRLGYRLRETLQEVQSTIGNAYEELDVP